MSVVRRAFLAALALVSLAGGWQAAHASTIGGVTVEPRGGRFPFNRPSVVTVEWKVTTTLGAGTQVFSTGAVLGAFASSGVPLCTDVSPYTHVPTPFSSLLGGYVSGVAGTGGTAVVRETIRIPAAWLVWARRNGYTRLDYIRYFDDGSGNKGCNVFKIFVTAGGSFGAADFGLSYVRLRFDDGSVARVVEQGTELRVRAEVRYRGHGLLRAVWEVADPARTRSGEVLYTPVATVHRYLTGTGRTVLEGPALPTTLTGLHLVRLRLIEPAIDAPKLFLRYFVRARAAPPRALAEITLGSPEPGAALGPDTRFAWAPVEGAAAYRLELYEAPAPGFAGRAGGATEPEEGARPVAGLLLAAGERSAPLSALAASRLRGPAVYLWRVVAFGRDGRPVAASPYRRLVVAADAGSRTRGDRDAGRD
ncbi:MAG TPA: hypothetical protein ENK20_08770 [Chromatiales bacterium]|nr:hypothetical protein [Chromatiales bacterium]